MMYWILWAIIAPIWSLLMPTRIIGKRYMKKVKKQATILSCNHQSLNDPILIKARLKPTSKMMAKSGLFKKAFPRWLLTTLGAYPVNREGNDITAVKKTLGYLKDNKTVTIFPEGTRGKTGELAALKDGLVMFALKTDAFIVPMIFKKKPKAFRFNSLLVGKPFKFSDFDEFKGVKVTKELLHKASEILSEKMQYLKDISIKEYRKLVKKDASI